MPDECRKSEGQYECSYHDPDSVACCGCGSSFSWEPGLRWWCKRMFSLVTGTLVVPELLEAGIP